jgi:hypothetical protein
VASGEWQPIETAPRDGTRFLAWVVTPIYDEDEGREVKEAGVSVSYHLWGGFVEYPARPAFVHGQRFTHWMPLPEPPEGI